MAIILSDDGTMDTVLTCDFCGEEFRYNYDPSENDAAEFEEDVLTRMRELKIGREQAEDEIHDERYDEFVAWAIEDAQEDHECGVSK